MSSAFWEQVLADGLRVPPGAALDDLTVELTTMLGDPDPHVREGIALPTMSAWIRQGVYDDLLLGLGDGIASGLAVGLGEDGTATVFRRSYDALVLTRCIERDTAAALLPADAVLRWGDQLVGWTLRERDLRGFVPGHGYAHAAAHGGDALAALARSPHLGRMELVVLLDVLADRLLEPTDHILVDGEPDRWANATLCLLRRDQTELELLEAWLARLGAAAVPAAAIGHSRREHRPLCVAANVHAFLRALHLHLALTPDPPRVRTDLLLALLEHLRLTAPDFLIASATVPT